MGAAPVFHWPLSDIITDRTLNVRAIFIEEVAKNKSVSYVDLFKNPKDDPFVKYPEKFYAQDKFHLTGDGYGVWYLDVQKKLL
jgi:lysophospholipase L1-like esterase